MVCNGCGCKVRVSDLDYKPKKGEAVLCEKCFDSSPCNAECGKCGADMLHKLLPCPGCGSKL
jgi:hypothetical protein